MEIVSFKISELGKQKRIVAHIETWSEAYTDCVIREKRVIRRRGIGRQTFIQ